VGVKVCQTPETIFQYKPRVSPSGLLSAGIVYYITSILNKGEKQMLKTVNLQKWQHEKFEELCKKQGFDFGEHHWVTGPIKIKRLDTDWGVAEAKEETLQVYYHTFDVRKLTSATDCTALDEIACFANYTISDACPFASFEVTWDYERFMFHCESSYENKKISTYLDFQEVFNIMLSREFKSLSRLD
jgi:hypothetical protein